MKKLSLILLTILFSGLAFSQTTAEKTSINTKTLPALMAMDSGPQVFIIIDSKKYEVEDFEGSGIKIEWIESVSVVKDDISVKINDRKKGAIFMYPKEKYEKRILRKLEKKKRS
ncbi:MAG: hypothetical protein IMY74_08410 [Bacteroidetes bacterium]|nr:hypothetical protein [Bacteroidota bacterium]